MEHSNETENGSSLHVSLLYCFDRPYLGENYGGPAFVYTRAIIDTMLILAIVAVNSVVILAIHFFRRKNRGTARVWNSGTSMKFVQMLALSDVLVGLTIPLYLVPHYFCDVNDFMRPNMWLCVSKYAWATFSGIMSHTSLISIAVDRFIAVQYTLQYRLIMTHSLCHRLIAGQIVISTVLSNVLYFWNFWTPETYCDFEDVMPAGYLLSVGIACHVSIIITVVGVHVQLHRKASQSMSKRCIVSNVEEQLRLSAKETSHNIKSAKTVLLVIGAYIICWTPYSIFMILRILQGGASPLIEFLFQIFFPLSLLNSLANAFIYAWKNSEIKNAVKWSIRRAST